MSILTPDTISVRTGASGPFNTGATGTGVVYPAQVEFDSKISYGSDGKPIKPAVFITNIPGTAAIAVGNIINVETLSGSSAVGQLLTDLEVQSVFPVSNGFKIDHLEVVC